MVRLDIRPESWEERMALFAAYLVEEGIQSSTLKSYISAIKSILRLEKIKWNDQKIELHTIVRACKIKNDQISVRLPMKKGLLKLILFETERLFRDGNSVQPYLECLYKVLFSLVYYGLMRVGELTLSPHTLKAKDMHIGSNKDKVLMILHSSKTHGKESAPQQIKITANAINESINEPLKRFNDSRGIFCPFELIRQFTNYRGSYMNDQEPFFVFQGHTPVRPENMRKTLKKILSRLGLQSHLYNCHSFHSGRSCNLFKYGFSVDEIRCIGRWRSKAVYKYLKD